MHDVFDFFIVCLYEKIVIMENLKIDEKIKTSDDGKGIFISNNEIKSDDKVYDYSLSPQQSFKVVCDPKSLLYIYGMQLDFSKDLIGGGFNFVNPNASQTCGCGSSFAV